MPPEYLNVLPQDWQELENEMRDEHEDQKGPSVGPKLLEILRQKKRIREEMAAAQKKHDDQQKKKQKNSRGSATA